MLPLEAAVAAAAATGVAAVAAVLAKHVKNIMQLLSTSERTRHEGVPPFACVRHALALDQEREGLQTSR